ncbi:hypothetical protein L6R52_29420 [Myxococcota bacterium]|nr:hypothetical protein [Myxococcota bacterium]
MNTKLALALVSVFSLAACGGTDSLSTTAGSLDDSSAGGGMGRGGHHRGPPEVAIDACASLAEGDVCSFTSPAGETVSSTCAVGRDGATLVCRPPQGGHGGGEGQCPGGRGRHGPDRAALCSGLAAGDACSATAPDGTVISGACALDPRDGTTLVCMLPPPAELVAACSGLAEGDACTLTTPDGTAVSSTCGLAHDGATLVCRPPHGRRGHGRH